MKMKTLKYILLVLVLVLCVGFFPNVYASETIRENDVSAPTSDSLELVTVSGTFTYTPKSEVLARLNEIRLEACQEGIVDPRDSSRNLTESDYVPIKWSSDLEWIAQTRAAEASVHMDHVRPDGRSWSSVKYNGIKPEMETLSWGFYEADLIGGIDNWYDEKEDLVNHTGGETGHYMAMINPDYAYIGVGGFLANSDLGAVAASYRTNSKTLDESQTGVRGSYKQKIQVKKANIDVVSPVTETIHIGETFQWRPVAVYENSFGGRFSPAVTEIEVPSTITYSSKTPSILTVDSSGVITGIAAGNGVIEVTYNGTHTMNITVEDHDWYCSKIVDPTCTEAGKKTYTCRTCEATKTETGAPATGHTWNSSPTIDIKPTCETEGSQSIHCSRCDAKKDTTAIPITDHFFGEWKTVQQASCETEGIKERRCIYCGLGDSISFSALGHKWESQKTVITAPTYASAGRKGIKCSVCHAVKPGTTVSIPKLTVKKTELSKVTKAKKAFTAYWKKTSGVTGYQVQYGLKKNLKGAKTVTIKQSVASKKISKLKSKKTYYVRMRSYKSYKGKTYYSSWSKTKSVKVK